MADIVDLMGTEYVSNIPAVYYSATGSILTKKPDNPTKKLE